MAGLLDYPRKFDDTAIPFGEWQVSYVPVENEQQSEGGTDLVEQVRANKVEISATLNVADYVWVGFFEEYQLKDSFTLSQYSPMNDDYETRTVRLRDLAITQVKKSERLEAVKGVWSISFTLKEF